MKKIHAIWLRNDFRIQDNPAVWNAYNQAEGDDGELLFFFHLHPDFLSSITQSNDYFFQTLQTFREYLKENNIRLQFLHGDPEKAFKKLLDVKGLASVSYAKDYTPFAKKRDELVTEMLRKKEIDVHACRGNYIHEPFEITKKDGTPYKVYTPYSKQWMQQDKNEIIKLEIEELAALSPQKAYLDKEAVAYFDEQVLPKCKRNWKRLGEEEAQKRMKHFLSGRVDHYDDMRDTPSKAGTSRLSPYLRTGAISARQIEQAIARKQSQTKGAETYIKELAWRDFYAMILHHFPETETKEFQEKFRSLDWNKDEDLLQAWKDGKTGFPIVDAGMRQLNAIGWMHNRLRMITASFLTKDFQIDWREGEAYFREKLIDHDPGSNIGGWQWAGSVGTDAVPYFRVFNPTTQSKRFDKEGEYIKKYVPELKDVPKKYIHEPHTMPESVQKEAGCIIGEDYPDPIVDHSEMRKRAIALYEEAKGD
ncbi:deoxyribodipyrimidine photo-lyase [Paenalkalicoccus suaedae]|uniref:Deoxyribodipyrimidine photo-lyase n=1 Tax=Paenalkalicoccus suaedae TaxID=2592382 RepID=A0A859FB29_9BACI|nr:deoxyribodipyrimidine photo-lyase [Paenalkalicoccus suaedae]QKS70563.1 deoxyribodipyrimidine photo-lyase [Paenalkalicoccus suaedae]